jgi:two-component system, NarL family, sensor histidine kinase DevS
MHSFLGVPIVIRGKAFGNLYLTDTRHGEFGDADEQSVVVLAEWASIAIDNARLYERVEGRRDELERAVRGLEATTAIARAVGAETDLDRVVQLIVKRARALVEARSAAILLLRGDDLYVAATAGELEQPPDSVRVPSEGTVFGEVLRSGDSESLADLSSRVRFGPNELRGSASTALLVPLLFRGRTQGVLMALDSLENGDPRFDSDAEYLLESFAAAAANAIATARSVEADRLRHSMHASEQERKRWARELHDETLQELGALRFTLTGALQSHDPERVKGALERAVDQIGLTIGGLQGLITELRPAALDELGLRPAIEALAERIRTTSGLEVELDIGLRGGGGAAPSRLAPAIENTAYRLVQEALNNTVKHARAERVDIAILEDEASLTITVHDDGTGFRVDGAHSGFGLLGMHERAELVGGEVSIESTLGEGTTVSATLPARHAADRAGPATQTG